MTKSLEYEKCLEIGKITKSLQYRKCLEKEKTTKSLGDFTYSRDFIVFLFLDTYCIQGILPLLLFLDTSESVWKQENHKILCWAKTVMDRGH